MANIRVDADFTIRDGSEIIFKAPCDCSEITGLTIHYPNINGKQTSRTFQLSDAHCNNVGDVNELFVKDAVVKVILDMNNRMAFIQNADTNAYLEGRFALTASTYKSVNGSNIVLEDATGAQLHNLTIYGKTTQSGVPTPDNPIDFESPSNIDVVIQETVDIPALLDTMTPVGAVGCYHKGTVDDPTVIKGVPFRGSKSKTYIIFFRATTLNSGLQPEDTMFRLREICLDTYDDTLYYDFGGHSEDGILLPIGYTWDKTENPWRLVAMSDEPQAPAHAVRVYTGKNSKGITHLRWRPYNDASFVAFELNNIWDGDYDITFSVVGSSAGAAANIYIMPIEAFGESQVLNISTPNGLPGIKVEYDGNYTDENGQQWVCDEIDFARGVYVQRVYAYTLPSDGSWSTETPTSSLVAQGKYMFKISLPEKAISDDGNGNLVVPQLCNRFVSVSSNKTYTGVDGVAIRKGLSLRIYFDAYADKTVDEFKTFLAENPTYILYALAEPIETALDEATLAAYASLHTRKPTTKIYNKEKIEMKISYYTETSAIPVDFGGMENSVLIVDKNGCVASRPYHSLRIRDDIDISKIGDYNNLDQIGIYYIDLYTQDATNKPPQIDRGWMFVYGDETYLVQEWHTIYSGKIIRTRLYGTWGEWEYENPPMRKNIEYRTTERLNCWNTLAVYTMLIDLGNAADNKLVTYPISGDRTIIRAEAFCDGHPIPYSGVSRNDDTYTAVDFAQYEMYIRTNSYNVGKTVYARIWYVKEDRSA